jgi:glycosyltransferase 2 family protein
LKRILWNLLRWTVPAAIIAWLVYQAVENDSFTRLREEPKQWNFLAGAALFCFAAVLLTMVRWYYLVRTLNVPLTWRDAFRLGFLGYLFNFISPGAVGGDLFKVVYLARERPGKRTEVALSVLFDRLLGLYAVFVIATIAILLTELWRDPSADVRFACRVMFWCTGISTLFFAMGWLAGFSEGPIARWMYGLPRIGRYVEQLSRANRMYYSHPWALPWAMVLSLMVQSLFAISLWMIARGLLSHPPSLPDHFVIVPMGMATGALPLAPNGLGTFELLVNFLYQHMPDAAMNDRSAGLLVSLAYRVITVLIAMVGVGIYWVSRKELSEVLHEAEAAGGLEELEEPAGDVT